MESTSKQDRRIKKLIQTQNNWLTVNLWPFGSWRGTQFLALWGGKKNNVLEFLLLEFYAT